MPSLQSHHRPNQATSITLHGHLASLKIPRRGVGPPRSPIAWAGQIALIALVVGLFFAGSSGANEAPLRNLPAAQRSLAEARLQWEQTVEELDAVRAELISTSVERDFLSETDVARLEGLETWRRQSRQLAVEAYIGGPDVSARIFMVDPDHAAELVYRGVLLREHVDTAITSSLAYANLVESSDKLVLDLAAEIDRRWRMIESLENDVENAQERVIEAEWVVSIAEIHAEADAEFAARGRREPTAVQWHELRMCESTDNYAIDSGNTFYGAYQFDYTTWFTVGGTADTTANMAPPEEQDARARLLYSRRGDQPWPVCGRFLVS